MTIKGKDYYISIFCYVIIFPVFYFHIRRLVKYENKFIPFDEHRR